MNTGEVREMFKSYTDESDRTFLTDSQITTYLSEGYNDFRRAVCEVDPFIYKTELLFTMPSTGIFDLTANPNPIPLLGPNSTFSSGIRLERLLRVARINDLTNNQVIAYLDAAPSEDQLGNGWQNYAFVNSNIITYATGDTTYRLEYVPYHNVDFGATNAYIDDLHNYHDMIPLYAYSRYGIRDGADNPQLSREIARKTLDLNTFLESGRSRQGSQYVLSQDGWF